MNPNTKISEKLLYYIWQYQKFNTHLLKTEGGESLQIVHVGQPNTNAGPDFLEAKILINDILWVGNVEIHVSSADWQIHNHHQNPDYDTVILHVVWENKPEIIRNNGAKIPALCLNSIVNELFFVDYQSLINSPTAIPCLPQFEKVNSITKILMLEKVLINRLERKAELVLKSLAHNQNDWEETTYQLIGKTMGFGLNSIPFERLTQIVPLKIIQKHADSILAIESILFGVAGFLEDPIDDYTQSLQKEYLFLRAKYNFTQQMGKHEWKFMRLRPANFPTVRIAQFAQIIKTKKSLFSHFILFDDAHFLKETLTTQPTQYWQHHYIFGETTNETLTGIGKTSIENLLINAAAPLLVAYSLHKNEPLYMEKVLLLLENLKSEANKITKFWGSLNFAAKNAFDSQAQIELYNEYCLKKACLNCNIGAALLK